MSSAKKKVTQDELRRLMNEQKKKMLNNVKKIESPLAKYDKNGVLSCIVCESVVKNEVWSVHINGKQHRDNISKRVKKREKSPPPAEIKKLKRPAPPPLPTNLKPIKSILKNAPVGAKYARLDLDVEKTETVVRPLVKIEDTKTAIECEVDEEDETGDTLPEGFFDDPKLDAKVRNVEYKDPIQEEWEQFQKEIKEEASKAQQIIAEDQEEATNERQIDEIDEQLRHWSRVMDLEKKKQEVIAVPAGVANIQIKAESSSDEEFEEFGDWRAKKSFH